MVKAEVSPYIGGGLTGEAEKTKHEWQPIAGQQFTVHREVESVEGYLPGEAVVDSEHRLTIDPMGEVFVPLIIEDLGGYIEGALLEKRGDVQVHLTCEATVVSTHQYLIREEGATEPSPFEDIMVYVRKFWSMLTGTFGVGLSIVIIFIGALLIIKAIRG